MRAERERTKLPMFALAGYTNAGKSTLMAALTGADVEIRDRLFHTLDPTTRVMELGGRTVLATDTVGFIRKLPHQLVKAFGATLEETRRADLIVHVVDASVPEELMAEMLSTVELTLEEIGAGDQPRLLVCNKIDQAGEDRITQLRLLHPGAVLISALDGRGLDELRSRIETVFLCEMQSVDLLLPFSAGAELAELHTLAAQIERDDTPDGVRVRAMLSADAVERFERFSVSPAAGGV
jgi:GTP-binding protein HflX